MIPGATAVPDRGLASLAAGRGPQGPAEAAVRGLHGEAGEAAPRQIKFLGLAGS